jgi:hypothetical protein
MKTIFQVAIISFLIFSCGASFAAMTLNVGPVDGSRSLRFDRLTDSLDNKKELRIRVSSTDGQRYQVYQRVQEPIVNEKGQSLNLRAVQVASSMGSNAGGTLYLQSPDYLGLGEQLIYTSSQAGDTDSFVLVYVVDPSAVSNDGKFFGKLVFTLRPMNGSSQEQSVVDLFIESEASSKVSVKGGRTAERVLVKGSDTTSQDADFVKIELAGNKGQAFKIYQELETLPQDDAAREISAGVLRFSVAGDMAGDMPAQGVLPLERTRTLLYTGTGGEGTVLVYLFADADKALQENAGTYHGKLRYIVETGTAQQVFLVDLACEIQPVFDLEVEMPPDGVKFNNVVATDPPQEREVMVRVHTNLQKPYQVSQDLQAPMTNEKGDQIARDFLMMKGELLDGQKGQIKAVEFVPMETGEHAVFHSDRKGSPAAFKVIYRLQAYPQISSGNFLAPIRFSLNQD